MDPFFARNRLSAYIDGQLPEDEARAVASAIEQDPELRDEYEAMRAAVTLLRERGPVRAPSGFHDSIMAAVAQQPRPGVVVQLRDYMRQIPVEAVALAAAALIVVVVLAGPGSGDPSTLAPPPPPDLKGGAAAPLNIEPAPDLHLPTAAATPAPRPTVETRKEQAPRPAQGSPSGSSELSKKAVPAVEEVYVAAWEQETQAAKPGALSESSGDAEQYTPSELYEGVQTGTTTYQYRITMGDADVLYNLQQLAQTAGGRLLDASGGALKARTLTVEDNYVRVQVVVPPSRAEEVHSQLARLGARALVTGSQLSGAEYVAFVIEVSYMP